MQNDNYWKEKYKLLWSASKTKEENFKRIVETLTGLILEPYGLGATSDDFISGSADSNGSNKGAPDFKIGGMEIFIEVTGPNTDKAQINSGIWIRPDKLKYAYQRKSIQDEWFALHFPSENMWMTIHADVAFFKHLKQNWSDTQNIHKYCEIHPHIRNTAERYISIPYPNPYVTDLSELINYLKARGENNEI